MVTRREFVGALIGGTASFVAARNVLAMQTTQTFAGTMEQDAYLPVKLAARAVPSPSPAPVLDATPAELEALKAAVQDDR